MTTGTWALESAIALQTAGLPVAVMAPTPWIPGLIAPSASLRAWSRVPSQHVISDIPVYYPRCPHYPQRWINNVLYNSVPSLDTALLWPWCRSAVDEIAVSHPFDVVHANFLFPSGYLGLKIKQRRGTPLVVHERSVQRLAMARAHTARRALYRRILREADLVITENESMARDLREMEPDIAKLRVFKQPGSHPETVSALTRERPSTFAERPVILSVGALSERKGHEYLIRAVAKIKDEFPGLACRIIGEGGRRGPLTELISRLGLEHTVELCGKRPHADVLGEMSWCDVFALPSWGEAGGTVYGEAMQFGKPIIACVDEGITDIMRDGKEGRLVPPRDVDALAEALRWLLSDPVRRRQVGERAKALSIAELGYPKLAQALIGLYGELVSARTRSGRPVASL